jgi:hypothetical protein
VAKRRGKLELAKTRLEDKISNSKLGKRRRSAKQKANDKRLGMSRKKTKSVTVKRKSVSKKSNTMAKRKSTRRFSRARSTGGKIFGSPLLKKAMIGIGAATLAGTVVNMVAPQFAPIAKPIAAFATGGVVGAAASLILSPDGLGSITGLFGGSTGTTTGGLSV